MVLVIDYSCESVNIVAQKFSSFEELLAFLSQVKLLSIDKNLDGLYEISIRRG